MNKFPCLVCGNYTITKYENDEICQVCFWHDDGHYDNPDEVKGGPNKGLSLTQAKLNYSKYGAVEEKFKESVRLPKTSEEPQ